MGKFFQGAKRAVSTLNPQEARENPGAAAGTVVGAGVTALGHPWLAIPAAKATQELVDRAMPAIRSKTQHFKESFGISRGDSSGPPPIQ
jgi:hypothetical protein